MLARAKKATIELQRRLASLAGVAHVYSPHIALTDFRREVPRALADYKASHPGKVRFLDVGGRRGEFRAFAEGFDYEILDIDERLAGPGVVIADICSCPSIADATYDVVFSNNVFEHLKEPWAAADECLRITKPGGLVIHVAPFSWRYHPVPVDYFRFSHAGLAYLFERRGDCEGLLSAYDLRHRREDRQGGKQERLLDRPPIDWLGGFRENWLTVYIGRKRDASTGTR